MISSEVAVRSLQFTQIYGVVSSIVIQSSRIDSFRLLPEAWLVPEGRDVEIRRSDGIPNGQPGVVAQRVGVGGQLGAFLGSQKCGKCTG